jgi:hypothetical protein
MVHDYRERRHAFSTAGVVGLLLTGLVCGVFWREVVHLILSMG